MKFSDFVSVEAIRPNVVATNKEGVIREMAQSLVDAGKIAAGELESIVKAIMKREDLGSTGIGRGVAVPHTKHPSVSRLIGTVAISQTGIDFDSLDGEPVQEVTTRYLEFGNIHYRSVTGLFPPLCE
jgi:PTS system fructose-specific IIA component/PTS system nitrogen regulatory IIA component